MDNQDYWNGVERRKPVRNAADTLESANQRIAELEAEVCKVRDIALRLVQSRDTHVIKLIGEIDKRKEAERKLAVAQEALKNLFLSSPIALECNDMHHAKKDQHEYDEDCPVLSRYEDALSGAREALAQIGGDE